MACKIEETKQRIFVMNLVYFLRSRDSTVGEILTGFYDGGPWKIIF